MKVKIPDNFDPEEYGIRAEGFFLEGHNCCQSVLLAFSDILEGVDEEILKTIGSGLGGGVARMREVCGAVSAMAILAGFISPACDPTRMDERSANYALARKMAEEFRKMKGSVVCRELLEIRKDEKESFRPSDRTPSYYHSRPCVANVGLAARIVADTLKNL